MSEGLSDAERTLLLTPCKCGHTLNDHGTLVECWRCEDEGAQCAVTFEDLLVERVGRMVAGRVEAGKHPAEIWIDRGRLGGRPCIYGHRLRTRSIACLVMDGGVDLVQKLYPYLTEDQIGAACWFEGTHGRHKKFRRWYRQAKAEGDL